MPKRKVPAKEEISKINKAIQYKLDCLSEGIEKSFDSYNSVLQQIESIVVAMQDIHDGFYGLTDLCESVREMEKSKEDILNKPGNELVNEIKLPVPTELEKQKPYTTLYPEPEKPINRTGEFVCLSQDEYNEIMGRLKTLEIKVEILENININKKN